MIQRAISWKPQFKLSRRDGITTHLLREYRLCAKLLSRRSRSVAEFPVDPAEVVVTPGAKPIIFFTLLALVESGDEVIYPNPGFPIYQSMIECAGRGRCRFRYASNWISDWMCRSSSRPLTPQTRIVILNSPSNPTGSVLSPDDLGQLAEGLAEMEVVVLSDEIYSHILYEGQHQSIASFPGMKERTIILDGFSKTYAMTGWRLGYGVMHPELAKQVEKLMINSNSCTAAFTQRAGVTALNADQAAVLKMVETLQARRDRVVKLLNEIEGISCRTPLGAFYVFPNVRDLGLKSSELERLLLHEAGVAALSGTAFGEYGEGYLRISYATSMEE